MANEKPRVLVVGASGFIGRATTGRLLSTGRFDIHTCSRATAYSSVDKPVAHHRLDLLDSEKIRALFETCRPDILVQTAWVTQHNGCHESEANRNWLRSNRLISEHFIANGGTRAIFLGTSAEYDWSKPGPHAEYGQTLNPSTLYGRCKYQSFLELEEFFGARNVRFVWTRLFCPFGPHENPRRMIPRICRALAKGERVKMDAATETRDFLYVSDVAEAIFHLIDADIQGAINVASGTPVSVRQVCQSIADSLGREDLIEFSSATNSALPTEIVADTRRLRTELGWTPDTDLAARIKETAAWWKSTLVAENLAPST